MKKKFRLFLLLALLMTAATGAWAQDYYAPSTDEVIILNEVYNASNSGYSSHSAIAWGGTASASDKKAGDPNNGGGSTSSTVSCYSVKGNGKGKNITLSITGVSKVIVYHERHSSRYIELRDGSKTGNIIGSGQTNTWYTEVELTATNEYSIFLHGTSNGSDDQDFNVYAIKLIAAPAAPAAAGYTVSLKDGVKDADKWTVKVGEGQAQALPIGGLKGDGSETVTLQYTGRLKVKGVKATSEAAPAEATYTLLSAATTEDVGKVVCAAGHLHDAKTAVPDGCTAVGILGKVTETGHGLILALQDATSQNWNTINDWKSVTTYAGTTLKVLPDDAARGTNLTSYTALGETTVSNWAVGGDPDYQAIFKNLGGAIDDWQMYVLDSNVNAYITTGVGGSALDGEYWPAWCAEELAEELQEGDAVMFYINTWAADNRNHSKKIRPVLGF